MHWFDSLNTMEILSISVLKPELKGWHPQIQEYDFLLVLKVIYCMLIQSLDAKFANEKISPFRPIAYVFLSIFKIYSKLDYLRIETDFLTSNLGPLPNFGRLHFCEISCLNYCINIFLISGLEFLKWKRF